MNTSPPLPNPMNPQISATPRRVSSADRPVSGIARFFSHGLAGFVAGEIGYTALSINLEIVSRFFNFDEPLFFHFYALALPALMTVAGFVLAVRHPVAWLNRPWVIMVLLALAALPVVLVLLGIILVMVTWNGYC